MRLLHEAFVIAVLCLAAFVACQSTLAASQSTDAHTTTPRDPKQRALFMQQHPCPGTGKTSGACPGYVVDHVTPLACGGSDTPSNMQWQTSAEATAKDQWELSMCGKARRQRVATARGCAGDPVTPLH